MSEGRSSLSRAGSYQEIGEFWDTHDLGEYWDETEPAEFEVTLDGEATYFALDADLSSRVLETARRRGVAAETQVNLWVQEKPHDQEARQPATAR